MLFSTKILALDQAEGESRQALLLECQQQNSEQLFEIISAQQQTMESIDGKQDDMGHQLEGFKKSLKKITAAIVSNPSHPLHNSLNNFRFLV